MRKVLCSTVVALGLCAGSAQAQGNYPGGYNPGTRPAYSPYLNLLRRDAPLVDQYYGLVRPQVDARNALQQLDAQQTLTGNQQTALENTFALPPTGHASRFQTHSRYFLTNGAGAGAGAFGGALGAQTGAAPAAQGAPAAAAPQAGRR